MQKLRPYIMPGLLLFHLMLLCVMIFTAREGHGFSPETTTVWATVFSSLFLTALWAGLGSEPWTLRIPGCGALAALCWIGFRVLLEQMMPKEEAEWVVLPLVAWIVLVGLLLCLRAIPFLERRIVLMPTPSGANDRRPAYSLTRGILIVVATWGGVFLLSKDSHHWVGLAPALERWVFRGRNHRRGVRASHDDLCRSDLNTVGRLDVLSSSLDTASVGCDGVGCCGERRSKRKGQ